MSNIALDASEAVLSVFAGQSDVTIAEIGEVIEQTYALARKRVGFRSYVQVFDAIELAGVSHRYTGPNYTGSALYTFPAKAL